MITFKNLVSSMENEGESQVLAIDEAGADSMDRDFFNMWTGGEAKEQRIGDKTKAFEYVQDLMRYLHTEFFTDQNKITNATVFLRHKTHGRNFVVASGTSQCFFKEDYVEATGKAWALTYANDAAKAKFTDMVLMELFTTGQSGKLFDLNNYELPVTK